jgi:threonine/homoserine/homoserine lactone efflux protein
LDVDPRRMRWVNRLAGAVIVALGATLLVGLR